MRIRVTSQRVAVLAMIVVCGLPWGANALSFTVTDLGTLGGHQSIGYGINDSGQTTGISSTGNLSSAFLHNGTTMQDLGGIFSIGHGINEDGDVVGYSYLSLALSKRHAFLYRGGIMQDLGTLGGSVSEGHSVNDGGQVTGLSMTSTFLQHAFLYDSSLGMRDLGTLGGSGSAGFGINNSGQVTGYATLQDDIEAHAFLYENGIMQDLGTLGGTYSAGRGLNSIGQVIGSAYIDGDAEEHAFLYENGTMHDLGTLGGTYSVGHDISDSGQAVGFSSTEVGDYERHAFIHDSMLGGMLDLNDLIAPFSGWILSEALAINNVGQITGYGTYEGETRAFLLTPVSQAVVPLPDPASMSIIGLGLASLAARLRKRASLS